MTADYIEILGGIDSEHFKKFRKYFFKGFMTVQKYQQRILTLVRMMYTANRESLPCFRGGQKCMNSLQKRINPKDHLDEGGLNIHCQQFHFE